MSKLLMVLIFLMTGIVSCNSQTKEPSDFLPEGYVIYETHFTDLNNDEQDDCILIIKDTNPEGIVINRFDKKVDRNRRGVIILFKTEKGYQLVDKNYNCFTSENEDGGVYYPPQLSIETDKGDIILNYKHGRYGYWNYEFRYLDSNYKLIKYNESSNYGPITNSETIINFLTKEKLFRKNINEYGEDNNEVFKETKTTITINKLLNLSDIKAFDKLNMYDY